MATQGTDYFALFMMNNQDRITRSLTQARRELDYAKAGQEFQRQYLMDQIAAEKAALAKIRTTKVTALSGGRGRGKSQAELLAIGKAQVTGGTALKGVTSERQKAGTAAISAYDIDGPQFMEPYMQLKGQHLKTPAGSRQAEANYLELMDTKVGNSLKPKVSSLTPKQQNEAVVTIASDIMANVPNTSESRAMQMAARYVGLSSEGMAGPAELPQRKMQEAEAAKAAIRGEAEIEEGLENIRAVKTGTGAATGPVKTTAPYLKEQATAAEDRIAALEDQLEELALDPVRMEDIRTRAGEIHAPYMSKRKQKEIEYAKTLRAMSLKGWQKNFAAAGVLGGQYADQIVDGEDFGKGSAGQNFGTNLFSKIESKDMTLPEAMAKISSSELSAEEQKKAVAVLVAQGILGSRRDNGPAVPGQRELEEDIRKAAKQSEEAWLERATQDLWGEEQTTPKRGRTSQAPAEQELEDIAIGRELEPAALDEFLTETSDRPELGYEPTSDPYDVVLPPTSDAPYRPSGRVEEVRGGLTGMGPTRARVIYPEGELVRIGGELRRVKDPAVLEALSQRSSRTYQDPIHLDIPQGESYPEATSQQTIVEDILRPVFANLNYELQPGIEDRMINETLLPDEKVRLLTIPVRERMGLVELMPYLNQQQEMLLRSYLQHGLD